jgi:DUF1680 family protein
MSGKESQTASISLEHVDITSSFWNRYRDLVIDQVLPYMWDVMNDTLTIEVPDDPSGNTFEQSKSHVIQNLRIAAGEMSGHHYGYPFQDSDAYKWLETVAYALRYRDDAHLRELADRLVDLIACAQDDDGYLVTLFQIDMPERKFARLQQSHELYTMGHCIEALVAYYHTNCDGTDSTADTPTNASDASDVSATSATTAVGKKALDIAIRMADCIDRNFGPEPGKIHGVDGHPEIEIALPKLFEATGDERYRDLAEYFIHERGQNPDFFDQQNAADDSKTNGGVRNDLLEGMSKLPKEYYMVDKPLEEQTSANGHAVRVVYMCTAMAHMARLLGDEKLLAACHRLWNNIVRKRMYITGHIGSTHVGESFTFDYDLPNDTMYGESCASVGMALFAQRMLETEHKGEYGDILEKELFNGALSGMSLDGKHFFYVNPLEANPQSSAHNPDMHHVLTHRAEWFGCACCPSNISRLIASVDRYLYTVDAADGATPTIYSHQFIANRAKFIIDDESVIITQTNDFPNDGRIVYSIENPAQTHFEFAIRIPSWSKDFTLSVDNELIDNKLVDDFAFIPIDDAATTIELTLDMSPKIMRASSRIREDIGKVAVMRGPMVYCAEEADNPGPLWLYSVPTSTFVATSTASISTAETSIAALPGVIALQIAAEREEEDDDSNDSNSNSNNGAIPYKQVTAPLSKEREQDQERERLSKATLTLIPYYAWANRAEGQMSVWIRTALLA